MTTEGTLKAQVCWVVGASGALGSAIAIELARAGATVIASGRNADRLSDLVQSISTEGGKASQRVLDICVREEVDTAASEIAQEHGRIDALVNSTAVSMFGDFLELSDEDWRHVLDAKLLGYVRTMRAVLPLMINQERGNIVNISGRGGRQPSPPHLPGGSANAGVNLLTKGVADAYLRYGIRANVVAPGPIQSDRFAKIRAAADKLAARGAPSVTTSRIGRPEDVAEAALWLLSEHALHITGAVIPVDGGATATV